MSDLKRCPLCKGENIKIVSFGYRAICVICEDCEVSTGYMLDDAEAEEAWNSRPVESELLERAEKAEAEIERLRAEVERQKELNLKLSQGNISLSQENAMLLAVLEKYADAGNISLSQENAMLLAVLEKYADARNWSVSRGFVSIYKWTGVSAGDENPREMALKALGIVEDGDDE